MSKIKPPNAYIIKLCSDFLSFSVFSRQVKSYLFFGAELFYGILE